ncbi:MAG: type III-A CRISPR-associated RAMP protein Csm5 [Lachnospiraceae bacterium]|nr:type III-A CRISPR-associated RAMP protein Csm5 [Lachnospiraceae bacterium]
MKEYLKSYDVKLEVIGPVFVGSGREINKKEYLFLPENKIGVIDPIKTYQLMEKRSLKNQYEDYMLNDNRTYLKDWFYSKGIKQKDLSEIMRYVLEKGDTTLQKGLRTQVMEFVKDPYGKAYIPGSTLKGMLRTIILMKNLFDNECTDLKKKFKYAIPNEREAYRNVYLAREMRNTEAVFLNTLNKNEERREDAVNDILSGFIISDSKPIEMDNFVLCQKIERHVDGTEKRLNLLRECIKPGTIVEFTITMDHSIVPWDIDYVIKAVNLFDDIYYEHFLSKFSGMGRICDQTVYVGGGAGYATKSIMYAMFREDAVKYIPVIFKNTNVPEMHRHDKDKYLGVAPHIVKCTYFEGETLQFGECRISF